MCDGAWCLCIEPYPQLRLHVDYLAHIVHSLGV